LPAACASRSSRIQRCSTLALTPSSRATCVTGLPESFANRTASDLYSSLYLRLDLRSDISNLRSRYCPPYEGVHEIGGGSVCLIVGIHALTDICLLVEMGPLR